MNSNRQIHLQEEAARCLFCLDAPCSKACKKGDPARAIRAIRFGNEKLLSVVGSAGSGKTSVAMHRIAYLMYRYRDKLEAEKILVLSPSNSFSEYISTVLPELGEENVPSLTLYKLLTETLKCTIEHPLEQNEKLLTPEG